MKGSDNTENNKSPSVPTAEVRVPIHNVRVNFYDESIYCHLVLYYMTV